MIRAVNRAVAVPFRLLDVDRYSLLTYSSSMNMCLSCVDVAMKPCVCDMWAWCSACVMSSGSSSSLWGGEGGSDGGGDAWLGRRLGLSGAGGGVSGALMCWCGGCSGGAMYCVISACRSCKWLGGVRWGSVWLCRAWGVVICENL